MKNLVTAALTSLACVFSLSSMATNVDLASGYNSTSEVLEYGRQVRAVQQQLANAGYVLQNCSENQINYFVQPSDPYYFYSETHCMYSIPRDTGGMSLQTDYAKLSMKVYYHQGNALYHEGDVTVGYFTVY
ncbi:hypothetical protein [Pseudoalteromonas sp. MMG005]|uniref:hypothetical protein n=1 Tax=Pseudoalteromonas sp. MMG005 TaxID=2822682 RepID=UPI001B39E9ED|nr:hypothetical protein [Pseudoalteromonas sp. MMG005]MBQ4845352.1 hypothetical protein [Pseudoalteromonas sp. MMG005]